jgi:hypothetical protein
MRPVKLAACVLVVAVATGGAVGAATRGQTPGDLVAVVAELKLLRQAVEDATKAQTQTQGLAVYLSAQQSRLVFTAGRLDAVRRELDASTATVLRLTEQMTEREAAIAQVAHPELRAEYQAVMPRMKRELSLASDADQRLRAREAALAQSLQQDESTWRDLIARLEQAIKR